MLLRLPELNIQVPEQALQSRQDAPVVASTWRLWYVCLSIPLVLYHCSLQTGMRALKIANWGNSPHHGDFIAVILARAAWQSCKACRGSLPVWRP